MELKDWLSRDKPSRVLIDVTDNEPRTIGEIAKALDIYHSDASLIVKKLNEYGLVHKRRIQGKGRPTIVEATSEGIELSNILKSYRDKTDE